MMTLKEARERAGLDQSAAAVLLGVTHSKLAKWEADPGQIRVGQFYKLCMLYGVCVNDVDIMATNAD